MYTRQLPHSKRGQRIPPDVQVQRLATRAKRNAVWNRAFRNGRGRGCDLGYCAYLGDMALERAERLGHVPPALEQGIKVDT